MELIILSHFFKFIDQSICRWIMWIDWPVVLQFRQDFIGQLFAELNPPLIEAENIPDNAWMYFVHTYVPQPLNSDITVAQTEYGIKFPSIIAEKNLFATQFHPEKSGKVGLQLLKNFTEIIKR